MNDPTTAKSNDPESDRLWREVLRTKRAAEQAMDRYLEHHAVGSQAA